VGLGGKVALAVAMVSALATTTVGLLAYQATESRLVQEVDQSLQSASTALINLSGRPMAPPGRGPMGDTGPRVFVPERMVGIDQYVVQVLGDQGEVLNASVGVTLPVNDLDAQIARSQQGVELTSGDDPDDGTPYRIITVGVPGGALQVARSLSETGAVLDGLGARLWTVVVLVTLTGAGIGWLVALGLTQRIRRLTSAADQVGTSGSLDVTVDVTGNDEAGRLGRALDRMLGSLAESRRQQQRLVEDAGHELRTPLTSLRTNLDVLRRHRQLPDDVQIQVLADLDRDVLELAGLVDEVVAVAADRHSSVEATRENLGDIIEAVATRVRRRSGRQINVTCDDTVAMVQAASIERAVANLIDNAVKFDASDAPIEVRSAGGRISVADRGPGIADDELDLVFQRFHRSAEARTLPGSGLGLSIVAKVTSDHGGEVFAANRAGGGAEIGLVLPGNILN
jgi:two-component system, OmpR family, sensor histidine kinase MprB